MSTSVWIGSLTAEKCFAKFAAGVPTGIIDFANEEGRSLILGNTLEEVKAKYPKYEIRLMDYDTFQAELYTAHNGPVHWENSTEANYEYAYECLPPAAVRGNRSAFFAFLVGEPVDHLGKDGAPRYDAFIMLRYATGNAWGVSSRPITIEEFNDPKFPTLNKID